MNKRFRCMPLTALISALLVAPVALGAPPPAAQASDGSSKTSTTLLPPVDLRGEPMDFEAYFRKFQQKQQMEQLYKTEAELQKVAVVDRKVMIPMRDGKKMAADIYRPKGAGKVPIILVRTPYNFNFWNVRNGAPSNMRRQLDAVKRGYAYVEIQERGHYFSQGDYDILGPPTTDGSDEVKWLTSQPWSNGKIGTTGCSSTAEWQLAVVSRDDPGLTTFNVQGFGAGVGRVGPYYEQGNWFRGGAVQMLFIAWLYDGDGAQGLRPQFPDNATQQQLIQASKEYDLDPHMPPVDWSKVFWHLPVSDMIRAIGGQPGIFDTALPVPTGGNMIARTPNSAAWYKGGLWDDDMPVKKPGLWFMSWFDVSTSPNIAAYNHVRRTAPKDIADQQYMVIAPSLHCAYGRASANTMIGDLDVGDARYDFQGYVLDWFDHFLKGADNGVLKNHPKVMYYLMGANKWKDSPSWPPPGAEAQTFYFNSDGRANTLYGDGSIATKPQAADNPDKFVYDPANPVPTVGAGGCCQGNAVTFGSFDQRKAETRNDVLVYDSPVFTKGTEVSGPITVTLYVSSDAKDTDFTFKVIDVYPDGHAYNLVSNVQRMRWRDGYDKPPTFMEKGKVYKVTFQPIDLSNEFLPGHKLRVAISSSNFPRFDRNLNTGANNQTTSKMVVAHNVIHHDSQYPSSITLTVLPASKTRPTDKYKAGGGR